MRRILWAIILFVVSAWATASAGQENPPIGSKRPVTVADTITMAQIGDQDYLDIFTRSGNVAYFSPDGSKFAFVTKKANMQNDTVEYSLLVFRSDEVFTSHHAELVSKLASLSNRPAITQLSWLPDNDSLVFIGEHPDEQPQLYRVNCSTKELERLTDSPGAVESYSFDAKGDSFVYEADVVPQPSLITKEMRHRGFTVILQTWEQLDHDTPPPDTPLLGQIFFRKTGMKTAKSVGKPGYFLEAMLNPLRISPDGRFTLALASVVSPPQEWSEYTIPGRPAEKSDSCSRALISTCPTQYRLIELDRGVDSSLLDAPGLLGVEQAAWTRDDSVLLVNTFLPLDTSNPAERSRRLKNVYAVEIRPETGKVTKISDRATPYPANMIEADPEQNRFTVRPNNAIYGPPTMFRRHNGVWSVTELKPAEAPKQKLLVSLDQGINTPPRLLASDPEKGRKAVVLDLNPQFAGLTFGWVELFDWKTRDGRIAEGELYYPPDYVPGKRYPLVIQTHGQSRERFWIDGPFTTAFAAQPLANRGFIVLQMGLGNRYDKASLDAWAGDMGTGKEGPTAISFFESAIDELDRRGLIDPRRVGLTGFSRTVYHVLYMLTHSGHPIAAAVVADGVDWGYGNCVFYLQRRAGSTCEKENGGGPPYGSTLAGWAKESPIFNLDKVQAPLLLQAISGPMGEWEIMAGLRWLNKPVEILDFYPEGDHILVRPQQRLLSQGSAVDWYCFWLKGEEDHDPAKAEQYERWRKLREERQIQTKRASN